MDGFPFGPLRVATYDLDGTGGVTAADFAILAGDIGSHAYRGRSDLGGDGALTASDAAVWSTELATHRSSERAVACP